MKYVLFACLIASLGCSGSGKKEEKSALVGVPPTAKDDPFFFVAMPSAAERAEVSGTIGSANESLNPNKPPPNEEGLQCFSCVQICAGKQECVEGDDLICGWGTHPVREVAMTRATAECDGALNLARYAPTWSKIEGNCPIATCKKPTSR